MSNAHHRSLFPSRVTTCGLLAALLAVGCSRDVGVSSEPVESADGGRSAPDASPSSTFDGSGSCAPDESAPVPADRCTTDPNDTSLPQCNTWIKVEPPGAVCSDGSQYKFFVSYSKTSNDVVMEFEPGGACWDYESCSGNGGIRGAANPHGIPDNHMATFGLLPLMNSSPTDPASNPVKEYNKIFVSYCTGDIHTGNTVATYTSPGAVDGGTGPNGTDTITFRHAGHANTLAVVDWMKNTFKTVPKLLVTGCSAGGAGALLNYAFIRLGMGKAVQCGYVLDDSGPIFHSDGPSKALHEKVRRAWNTDPLIDELKQQIPIDVNALKTDFGLINTSLAGFWKKDRFALTAYRMDFNYSLYSYQRFFPNSTEAEIHQYWWEDLQALMKTYDSLPNTSYFLPFFRSDNCSHCDTIPPIGNPPAEPLDLAKVVNTPWTGTEIQKDGVNVRDFVITLLDDTKPLQSHVEEVQPNESFSPEVSALCMEGAGRLPGQ